MQDSGSNSAGRPTRQDVAALARVSGATVSRVLSGNAGDTVSAKSCQRVLDAARELGYRPNSAAKALRSGHSGLIGFWTCLEFSRYRAEVLGEMREIIRTTDFAISVNDVDLDYTWHHTIDRALRVPVQGVIAFEPTVSREAMEAVDMSLPFVSMGAYWIEGRSFVGIDLQAGAEAATEHLLTQGYRRIVYVKPQGPAFLTEGARYEGYLRQMKLAGREPVLVEVCDEYEARRDSLRAAFACGPMPDALLCYYDDLALDALEVVQGLGLTPGKDIAVVGFNGQLGTERGQYPLTTVRQPIEKMCSMAFEFLKNQLRDPRCELEQVMLKPELVVRRSSVREA